MNRRRNLLLASCGLLTVLGVAWATAGTAQAAAQTFRDHETFPVAGDVFSCQGGDLTVTGGTLTQTFQGTIDARGLIHFTGTAVPHGVMLTDGTNTYTLSGASWFGGTATGDPDDPASTTIVETDTEHFVIRSADGGAYAKVSTVSHLSPNGKSFSFDFGSCETPTS